MKNLKLKHFFYILVILSGALSFIIAQIFGLDIYRMVDIFSAVLPVVILELVLIWFFIKWGWRWPIFKGWLVPLPDLTGTWEGHIVSDWVDPKTSKRLAPIPAILTINQSFFTISCVVRTGKIINESYTEAFLIDFEREVNLLLPNIMINETIIPVDGLAFLEFTQAPEMKLTGRYWTERKTTGEISLNFRSKEMREEKPLLEEKPRLTDTTKWEPILNFTNKWFDIEEFPINTLMTDEEIKSAVIRLKNQLKCDLSEEVQNAIRTNEFVKEAISLPWWQRIKIPGTNVYTTSDHTRLQISNPGWVNTLYDQLTAEEGFILRPMPKWEYLKPIMPNVEGKSILDIGCNNGFFCFEFADAGASKVTGVEVVEEFIKPAIFMREARGLKNVNFFHTDALLDLSVERHDIVFMSEVHGHFVDPLFGILRAVNLAKEHLVIDGAAINSDKIEIDLGGEIDVSNGRLAYHSWILSDGLMLKYLYLCGVEPSRVSRYVPPWPSHIVYIIDTSNVEEFRKKNDFQPCNTSFINNRFIM